MNKVKKILWLILIALALLIGWWIVQDNPGLITVRLFGFDLLTLPTGLCLLVAMGIGCLLGLLATTPTLTRSRYRARQLGRQLSRIEQTPTDK